MADRGEYNWRYRYRDIAETRRRERERQRRRRAKLKAGAGPNSPERDYFRRINPNRLHFYHDRGGQVCAPVFQPPDWLLRQLRTGKARRRAAVPPAS